MSVKNVLLVLMMVVLAGCASKGTKEQDDLGYGTQSGPAAGAQSGGVSQGSVGAGSAFDDSAAAGPRASARNRTVYFDFDSDNIKAEYREIVAGHGRYLAANPGVKVRLEGNTDERGSREYNIGLGERRAQAVKQALLLQGAAASQLTTVSYGEERPAATGSDEESWALNRRVEIVYVP
ncbi:MAG: peptidoglycan-associated lipoprotein Pal [Gammaproteobacteria bacterium]|nr:peptidoglycan-associated lipoprotein Pal [Gammaproteobacteria bacterium]